MIYLWKFGECSITVDAQSWEDAEKSFMEILKQYFPSTYAKNWVLQK